MLTKVKNWTNRNKDAIAGTAVVVGCVAAYVGIIAWAVKASQNETDRVMQQQLANAMEFEAFRAELWGNQAETNEPV